MICIHNFLRPCITKTRICTFLQLLSERDMKYPEVVLQTGEIKDMSESEDLMDVNESIISEMLNPGLEDPDQNLTRRRVLFTPESQVLNRRRISNDKSNTSRVNTQIVTFTRISDPDSTSRGKGLRPFWTESSKKLSERLLLPTKIGSVGTDLNSSSISVNNTGRKSWSRTIRKERIIRQNLPKISLPFVTSSLPETTGEEVIRARKLKLFPSETWKVRLRKWMGTARWTYNKCLHKFKTKKCKMDRSDFRAKVLGSHNHGVPKKKCGKKKRKRGRGRGNWDKPKPKIVRQVKTSWVLETPMEVRDSSMVDLINAFSTNIKKRKKDASHTFQLSFRTKKDVQTIRIPGKSVLKGCVLFPKFTDKEPLKCEEDFSQYSGELKIQMDRCGDFFAIVQSTRDIVSSVVDKSDLKVCAMDPGVRTFNTVVDNTGNVTEFSPDDVGRIYRHCYHMDKLQGKMFQSSNNSKKKYRVSRAWHRSIRKLKNLVLDVHRKCCKYLCQHYDVVFVPVFNTKNMVSRAGRKINSKTSRVMMTWSHFRFRQMLKAKAVETGTFVKEVSEEYTSKTCTRCGSIHRNLGSSKVYNCKQCRLVCDRDENGARNILIKSLLENEVVLTYQSA